ncbi:hypothetical protein JSCD4_35670 [Clostridioides difficile]|uniref:Uncharacterized protein n=1 Tax=Clostridioides difficile NAP08 TaxID=525259 RepID=D5Q6Y5_CLODI|nr:hypothetical protein HMPREF0220_2667 [Clostridioides difficile NAP08]EFH15895.1 hypothetical protein HMPREF0219_1456 [Clostridioides difficile NAP07]GCA61455.1 hypothetical protein TNHP173_31010 [Clostridioides difficile]GMK63309.1 hypothetical protein JSCD1_32040 [Clostridioides difficile]GMK65442.1 hypothetical protein JSCD2_17740 [Clostridioides difficile]
MIYFYVYIFDCFNEKVKMYSQYIFTLAEVIVTYKVQKNYIFIKVGKSKRVFLGKT